jgi:hydrogenase/urease accessory protein HupE
MKHYPALALSLIALPAAAHPGHTDDPVESMLHALVGHAPMLAIGVLAAVVSLGLLVRLVRARRRQLDGRGQLGM